ncbi:oxidoreductase [Sphingosinicella sp. CPCC 101087]|uniref:oxidoreductase n=1 Tax=Sphingosinicella sp. CPCC 101087 TaxID=2497754 RepID=UPI00101BCEB3|nr:oxidoreductase [Sphingosinicella sp. CPCC 101087]
MTIRTGLIGYGLGGAVFHAPLIRSCPLLSLEAVATRRAVPEGLRAVSDPQALIADPAIDLIVISTPNASHFPLAMAALEAGKHVVVDKPFAASAEQADRLIALAHERDRRLTVFHNRRWDGDFLTVRELLASGRIGEVMLCEMHWDRFRLALRPGWKDEAAEGTGLLYDLGSHLIDQALVLFGAPERISGDLAVQRSGAAVDDYFALTFHYGPRRVILSASTLVAAPRPRFALYAKGGSLVKFGIDPQEDQLKTGLRPDEPGYGEEPQRLHGIITLPDGGCERIPTLGGLYPEYYRRVAAAIAEGAPVPIEPADARLGLAIIEAARQSAEQGCAVEIG